MQETRDEHYANLITEQIRDMLFNENCPNYINPEELANSDNFCAFIHAFANLAPCHLYNHALGEEKDVLEFNHIANKLCFDFESYEVEEEKQN